MSVDTARLVAAGITRVPFSLENADSYCPGRRIEVRNALAGLCIACEIRDPGGRMEPAAFKRADGCIECPNRRSSGTVNGDEVSANHGANVADGPAAAHPYALGGVRGQHPKE